MHLAKILSITCFNLEKSLILQDLVEFFRMKRVSESCKNTWKNLTCISSESYKIVQLFYKDFIGRFSPGDQERLGEINVLIILRDMYFIMVRELKGLLNFSIFLCK